MARDTFDHAYPPADWTAAGLSSLDRTFTLDRARERLRVEDEVAFAGGDNEFVEVLVSYDPIAIHGEELTATGERAIASVAVDPTPDDVEVERPEEAVHENDVRRARLSFTPATGIEVTLDVRTSRRSERPRP